MSFPWFRMTLLGGGRECYLELANTEADRNWNPARELDWMDGTLLGQ
jgi:hypothetical protein